MKTIALDVRYRRISRAAKALARKGFRVLTDADTVPFGTFCTCSACGSRP